MPFPPIPGGNAAFSAAAALIPALIASTSTPEGNEGEKAETLEAKGGSGAGGCGNRPRGSVACSASASKLFVSAVLEVTFPLSFPFDLAVVCFCLVVDTVLAFGGSDGDA